MTTPPSTVDDRVGCILSNRFRILRLVASGGMANVYAAEDLSNRRSGALKLLRPEGRAQPDAVARLTREATAAARLVHPHIVRVLDAGKLENGEPFVFMELLGGESLDKLLARRGRLPISEAVEIAAQAAEGLCAAHAVGVLHRDVKPANLFLSDGERDGIRRVKLLDFGVSKLSDVASMTHDGFALGTFSFMPPEQMMSAKRVDARADVYALGVVLYRAITGRLPFAARSLHALMQAMEAEDYPRPARLRPDAPPEIDDLLSRCLRADPRHRYPTAHELLAHLAPLRRKSLPLRTISIGPAGITPTPAPPPGPSVMRAVTPAPATAPTGSLLIETVVPKTHREQ